MTKPLTMIGFDADDTLWHNEHYFVLTQDHFADLLREHTEPDRLMERLLVAEQRNIPHYGFGIKGFTLSMIETAIDVTNGKVPASVIAKILDAGREMLSHPVDLLPHAQETLAALQGRYTLVLITKGDLLDQERKLALSGLREMFNGIEIVSDKTPATYRRIFSQFGDGAEQGMMVGNSMKSDVVPMVDAGGWGIHVPHGQTWALEHADAPHHAPRFRQIGDLSELEQILT
ncbi:putative hydrolase of the HAD superfamily [Sulfitobacter marinus]|uniref:Putative hydrolase of the HAD superfamily n=1 Tax=Sulfitobacter marinus TaxID=394264 RepID=A0A1I6VI39_9RHOB|nr:HAD family hydrolase [Sulfitobacter marinus]SFT13416.1 putative hydrolase of the HAD superfamily [Sulfitobacter marinus]